MMADSASSPAVKIPNHIAIIMDGNGRWAKAHGVPRLEGHRQGTENLRRIIRACADFNVKYLTVYAFSTENWGRSKEEVDGLMNILETVIDKESEELNKENVRLVHIGRLEELKPELQKKVQRSIELTKNNTRLTLCIAWNYGGRDEILYAVQKIIRQGIPADQVTEETISQNIFTTGIPDPDLVVRTSGEFRMSNFLVWQTAYYSEWYVSPVLWPDFGKEELWEAIQEYSRRDRRFGKRNPTED